MEGLLTNWIRVQGTGGIPNSSFFSQFLVMDLFIFFFGGVLKAWLFSLKNLGCFFGVGVGSLTTRRCQITRILGTSWRPVPAE